MPGQPSIEERVASLETWHDNHKCEHAREEQRQQGFANRKVIIITAVIGFIGVIFGTILGIAITYLIPAIAK